MLAKKTRGQPPKVAVTETPVKDERRGRLPGDPVVVAQQEPEPTTITDDEESDVEVGYDVAVHTKSTQARAQKPAKYSKPDEEVDEEEPAAVANGDAGDEEDEDEEDEDDEEVFVVENILDHMIDEEGILKYKVKWEGYEKKADQTWEPEEILKEGASEILEEYLRKVGGRDKIFSQTESATKGKKRSRRSSAGPSGTTKRSKRNGHPSDKSPARGAKEAGAWAPPAGSWEDHIESIDACEDETTMKLIVFLNWKNGKKTKHNTEVIYRRCPQKMLRFYENHVRIVKHETASGNEPADMEAAVAKSTGVKKN